MNVDGLISKINALSLVDRDDKPLLINFLDRVGLWDVNFDAGLQNGGGDHENDEEHEDNVDERDHVDLGERALRLFGELRHKFEGRPRIGGGKNLRKRFFDLGTDFQRKRIEALRQFANVLQKLIVKDNRWDSDEKTRGGGDERFGDAGSHGAKAGRAGISEAGEGINDAPNGAEETDERRHGTGSRQPGHALFDAANLFRGRELHADSDGLKAFQFSRGLRVASAHLA